MIAIHNGMSSRNRESISVLSFQADRRERKNEFQLNELILWIGDLLRKISPLNYRRSQLLSLYMGLALAQFIPKTKNREMKMNDKI